MSCLVFDQILTCLDFTLGSRTMRLKNAASVVRFHPRAPAPWKWPCERPVRHLSPRGLDGFLFCCRSRIGEGRYSDVPLSPVPRYGASYEGESDAYYTTDGP